MKQYDENTRSSQSNSIFQKTVEKRTKKVVASPSLYCSSHPSYKYIQSRDHPIHRHRARLNVGKDFLIRMLSTSYLLISISWIVWIFPGWMDLFPSGWIFAEVTFPALYPLSWCALARGKHLFTCSSCLALIVSVDERTFPKRFNLRRDDRMFPGWPARRIKAAFIFFHVHAEA